MRGLRAMVHVWSPIGFVEHVGFWALAWRTFAACSPQVRSFAELSINLRP